MCGGRMPHGVRGVAFFKEHFRMPGSCEHDIFVIKYNGLSEEEKKTTNTPMIETLKHYQAKLAFEPIGWSTPIINFGTYGHEFKTLQPDPKYNYSLRVNKDGTPHIPELAYTYYWSEDKII